MKKNLLNASLFFLFTTLFNPVYSQYIRNYALDYDGVDNQYTTLPTNLMTSFHFQGDYTVEMWVYWRGGADWQRVFDFGADQNWYMFLTPSNATSHTPRFAITQGSAAAEQQVTASNPLTQNAWHHMAVVYTFSSTTATLYIDGVADGTNTNVTIVPFAFSTATVNDYLGKSQFVGDPYFNGIIDELRISDNARYTATFTPQQTNFSTLDANTYALFHFDEGLGQNVNDTTGTVTAGVLGSNNLVESIDPTWTTFTILPVGLEYFKGVPSGTDAQLTWRTATEQNNKGFDVERSTDGVSFSSIGFVNGTGNSTVEVSYNYTDYNVQSPTVWYRLKQEDIDGHTTYSGIVELSFNSVTKLYWYAAGAHTIEVRLTNGNDENFSVTDMSGRVIRRGNLIAGKTLLASLSQGAYTVSVIQKNGTTLSIPFLSK
jgi:hypothetical protein